jgi:hypothetical protein
MIVTIPIILTSIGLAAWGAVSMTGAVTYGVLPVLGAEKGMKALGYEKDEGWMTDTYGKGVVVAADGDAIGQPLLALSKNFQQLKWIEGVVFCMTVSEAELLNSHVKAIEANGHWQNVAKMMALPPEVRKEHAVTEQWFKDQLEVSILPLSKLLKAFPKGRTKTATKKKAA